MCYFCSIRNYEPQLFPADGEKLHLELRRYCSDFCPHGTAENRWTTTSRRAAAGATPREKGQSRAKSWADRMNAQLKYLVALAMLLAPSVSFAHSWYDPACCAGQDCKPVPVTDLKKHPDGRWEYLPLHQYFNPDQERPSGDANYHVCIGVTRPEEFGGMAAPIYIPRCIYVPPIRSSMSASPAPSSIFCRRLSPASGTGM